MAKFSWVKRLALIRTKLLAPCLGEALASEFVPKEAVFTLAKVFLRRTHPYSVLLVPILVALESSLLDVPRGSPRRIVLFSQFV